MMNRLFSYISSDEHTLDQKKIKNEQSTNQRPNKGKDHRNKHTTEYETTLCATCKKKL